MLHRGDYEFLGNSLLAMKQEVVARTTKIKAELLTLLKDVMFVTTEYKGEANVTLQTSDNKLLL